MIDSAQIQTDKLWRVITETFSDAELQTLCFQLNIDYDDLPPGGKSDKARELVKRVEREKRLSELAKLVIQARSNISVSQFIVDTSTDLSPFKGLLAFEEQDADVFFGRETITTELVERITDTQELSSIHSASFLALVGASGSGKSSIARAGLIPVIRQKTDWPVYLISPTEHPLESLATALTQDSESVIATSTLIDDLQNDERSLHLFARRLLAQEPSSNHILVVVDQFEELFTQCRDDRERRAFVDNLVYAVSPESGGQLIVVITIRADFYSHCLVFNRLHKLLEQKQRIVPPMNKEELRAVVEHPATKAELVFEDGLVDLILRDVGNEPGNLPLLSHVLLETWIRREGNQLTLAGYTDAGGVHGAIAKTAESTYRRLSADQQSLARNIFLRLTELGEGTQDTRRRASLDELLTQRESSYEAGLVLQQLINTRLITTSDKGVQVSHEALIREWPTLRHWLDEDREGLRIHRQLTEAARNWSNSEKDDSYLYRGARLETALEWEQSGDVQLNQSERSFLASSQQYQKNELAEAEARTKRLRRLTYFLGLAVVLMVGLMYLAYSQLILAQARQLLSQAQIKYIEEDWELATLLALESNRLVDTEEANNLINGIPYQQPSALSYDYPENYQGKVSSLAWSETDQLSVGFDDGVILLWDLEEGGPIQLPANHTAGIIDMAWSSDGKLVSSDKDGRLLVWEKLTQQPTMILPGGGIGVNAVAWSKDGQELSVAQEKSILLWRDFSSSPDRLMSPANVESIAWSTDGILASGAGNKVIIWYMDTGQPIGPISELDSAVTMLAWSDDGLLAAGSEDGEIIIWNVESEQLEDAFSKNSSQVNSLVWLSNGQLLSSHADGKFVIWDKIIGALDQTQIDVEEQISSVAWTENGKLAFSEGDEVIKMVSGYLTRSPCEELERNLTQEEWLEFKAPFSWSGRGKIFKKETMPGQIVTLIGISPYQSTCENLPSPEVSNVLIRKWRIWYGSALILALVIIFLFSFGVVKLGKQIVSN